jgi:hypothetical protein
MLHTLGPPVAGADPTGAGIAHRMHNIRHRMPMAERRVRIRIRQCHERPGVPQRSHPVGVHPALGDEA